MMELYRRKNRSENIIYRWTSVNGTGENDEPVEIAS